MATKKGDTSECVYCGKAIEYNGTIWNHCDAVNDDPSSHYPEPTVIAKKQSDYLSRLNAGDVIGVVVCGESKKAMWDGNQLVLLPDEPPKETAPERRKFRKGDVVKFCGDEKSGKQYVCVSEEFRECNLDTINLCEVGTTDKFSVVVRVKSREFLDLVRAVDAPPDEQPAPTPNNLPAVWDLVQADMKTRDALGERRYGVRLQPHNGRDSLWDAYEEAMDQCVYLRKAIYERDGR